MLRQIVLDLCEALADRLRLGSTDWTARIEVDDGFIGKGYGLPMDDTWKSIQALIASDGILCDPVYSGKALHGLLTYLDDRRSQLGRGVAFWHTGGGTGLLAYVDQIDSYLSQVEEDSCST